MTPRYLTLLSQGIACPWMEICVVNFAVLRVNVMAWVLSEFSVSFHFWKNSRIWFMCFCTYLVACCRFHDEVYMAVSSAYMAR